MIPLTWLWVLGSVVLLLILLLLSSIHISFSYDNKAKYKLRWFLFSVTSEDKKKKPAKEKKSEKAEKEKKEKPKDSFLKKLYKGEGLTGIIYIIREAAQIAQGALKYLFGHLVVKKFDIDICVSGDNAAETAVLYGQVCAAVYPCAGFIVSNTKCRSYNISIYPDFNEKAKSNAEAEFKGRVKLIFVFKTAAVYGMKLFRLYKNRIIKSIIRGEIKIEKENNKNDDKVNKADSGSGAENNANNSQSSVS